MASELVKKKGPVCQRPFLPRRGGGGGGRVGERPVSLGGRGRRTTSLSELARPPCKGGRGGRGGEAVGEHG